MARKQSWVDPICGVVAAHSIEAMMLALGRASKLTQTIELRLDWLVTPRRIRRFLRLLSRRRINATLIATCRRHEAGGSFRGSVRAQLDLLQLAVSAGCGWCDVEVETVEVAGAANLKVRLRPARLIHSFHDFHKTPKSLSRVLGRLTKSGGDALKIATQCSTIKESVRVLELARGSKSRIAVPMGEIAVAARILALREGSYLAYGAISQTTAPGQTSIEDLRKLYRADELDRNTRVYGVIGNPVAHSLSPLLHNSAFQACGMNAVYLPFLVRDLKDFVGSFAGLSLSGFSITSPFKEQIIRYLDDCDPLAAGIGAVNTVVMSRKGRLHGMNTDYVGVLRALECRVPLRSSRVLIIGAGGAARAVAFALAQAGARVHISSRKMTRAVALARDAGAIPVSRTALRHSSFDAIVNATPVGMHPRSQVSPLSADELNCKLIFDLVYRPQRTKLLRLAHAKGIQTVSGIEMFLVQGIAQWEIWNGKRAPALAMRRAVYGALRREEARKFLP